MSQHQEGPPHSTLAAQEESRNSYQKVTDYTIQIATDNSRNIILLARQQATWLENTIEQARTKLETANCEFATWWFDTLIQIMVVELDRCRSIEAAHRTMVITMEALMQTPGSSI
ncbi:hypothetical protein FLAG1_08143 [Fusarium langsethiae]|uniref:Uncharacterized protein n=1 Tax=Fusarium langsethiae TaxID=179993 RepID=A0A0M9ESY2_FUSLA|nr:hypothetical protein FLAG1_08143 [Fusarium langsethiae]GKU05139.1 unnamed protein product [Fusarium langsethiae]GKU15461.1 unnamed protein product [Fusarium langsethiae]